MADTSDGTGAGAPRARHRGRTAPTPRAVVGGLLVTVAAVAALAAVTGDDGTPAGTWVVVTGDVDAGQPLDPAALAVVRADLPPDVAEGVHVSPTDLAGVVALTPLRAGDLVLRSAVLTGDPSAPSTAPAHEFSFALARERAVNASLARGEVVDVLATYGTGDAARTVVAARQARVLDLERGDAGGLSASGMVVLTLAVAEPEEVLALAHASDVAEVTVVRATRAGDATLPDRYLPDGPTS